MAWLFSMGHFDLLTHHDFTFLEGLEVQKGIQKMERNRSAYIHWFGTLANAFGNPIDDP
jgi:hypothetical protein